MEVPQDISHLLDLLADHVLRDGYLCFLAGHPAAAITA